MLFNGFSILLFDVYSLIVENADTIFKYINMTKCCTLGVRSNEGFRAVYLSQKVLPEKYKLGTIGLTISIIAIILMMIPILLLFFLKFKKNCLSQPCVYKINRYLIFFT